MKKMHLIVSNLFDDLYLVIKMILYYEDTYIVLLNAVLILLIRRGS